MNKKYELFPKHEMKITVFQALTLLANKYRDDLDNDATYQTIQSLYLSGVRSYSDAGTLDDLLEDPCLAGFVITTSKSDITLIHQDHGAVLYYSVSDTKMKQD